jgi:hypothetical protein
VLGNVVTQTRYDQNGCGSLQFVHFNTFAFTMTRLAVSPESFCWSDIKEPATPALFI